MRKTEHLPSLITLILIVLFSSASQGQSTINNQTTDIHTKVDNQVTILKSSIKEFNHVLSIDHSRLAGEAGVYTPPSIVTLFSNPKVNSELIRLNPLTGIDLPYKVLCYAEPDTANASIAYTSSTFIQKRHGLKKEDLRDYEKDLKRVLANFSKSQLVETNLDKVGPNFGIIKIKSAFDFETTVQRLKAIVNAQSDTKWFGEIDFQKEAKALNIDLNKTTLLLFGGPAPGGQAMFDTPKIGLDAFCQKLLVFSNESNEVIVAFNDIPAFSELYYGRSTKPQELINGRLKSAIETVLSNNN